MLKALNYQTSLYLLTAIALLDLAVFFYVAPLHLQASNALIVRVAIDFTVAFGIWVQSPVVRYVGAAWLLFSAASMVWTLRTADLVISVPLVLFLLIAFLCLITLVTLVFSKTFSEEFFHQRKSQPAYKKGLKRVVFSVVLTVMAVGTLVGIYRLTQE